MLYVWCAESRIMRTKTSDILSVLRGSVFMSGKMSATPRRSPGGRAHSAEGETGTVHRAAFSFVRSLGQTEAPVPISPSQSQRMGMADQWPLRTFLELGAL